MKTLFTIPFAVFSYFFAAAQTPVNDDCAGIVDLGEVPYCSQPAQFTNLNATTSNIDATANVPVCWNNLGDRDVWFQFSLPANGSIVDVSVAVWGNVAGNGTLKMPQLAVYRGDCEFGGLAELACIAAPLNVNELHLDLFGLTPGVPYFLRINDYSANASPNSGTFKLCVGPYVPDINIGDVPGTASCSGTLWDSGGPDGDYQSNENETFVICPSEFHQCIKINFVSYATEFNYDFIRVYAGDDIGGNLLQTIDDMGANLQIQVPGDCVTIEFSSDGSVIDEGFQMTWQCSAEVCDAPPPTLPPNATCDQALNINGCSNGPQIISLSPGAGDPNFIQDGVNQGCFDFPSADLNFSFFYFQAAVDGEFGFLVKNANPANPADIDFSVWGPIGNVTDICGFVSNNQPVRSSWTYAPDPILNPEGLTGLTNTNPVTGAPVTDNFDCGSPATPGQGILITDDSFVSTLQVQQGEIYVVLLDNFDGAIENDGIDIDFSGTSVGALGPLDAPIMVSNDTISCNGVPVQLQVTGGVSFAWTPSAGLSCNTCPNPFASPSVTTTYEVKVLDVCQSLTESVVVSVGPTLLVQNDTSICNGQSVVLGHTLPESGVSYAWTPNDGSIDDPSSANPNATPLQTTEYTLTATIDGCMTIDSITINIIPVPILTITPANPQLCLGESTPLVVGNAAGLTNPQWSPPIGLSCITCTTLTAAPDTTTTYQFTADVANGCTTSAMVIVEVNEQPQYQFPNDTLCAGESILLNLIADSTVSYLWTSNPPVFFSTAAQPMDTLQQTTTYLVTMENGCTVNEMFTIQVVPAGILTVSDGETVCSGVSAELKASSNYPGTYEWSNGTAGPVIFVSPAQTTTYTVTYSYPIPTLRCQIIDSVTIGVQGEVAQVQFPSDTLLCPGDSVLLNLVSTPGATYTWSSDPPIFASIDSIPPVFYPKESARYSVLTTLGSCTVIYNVDITVFNPQMVVSEDTTICAGEPVTISADAFLTGDYQWTPGGTAPTFVDTVTANSQYTLRFDYGEGCIYEDTVNVMVIPNFTLKLVSDPDTNRVNAGESILLDAFVPGTNVSNFTFDWLENNTNPIGNTQQVIVTPITLDSTVTYLVTVVSNTGCIQTESITFAIIQPNVKIPTAFTPNGDGSNDSFGLAIVEGVASIEKMEVYSRWGQKIFASNDPNARWDGTIDGNDAPSDVYVYVIFWRGGDGALSVAKGELTLLR